MDSINPVTSTTEDAMKYLAKAIPIIFWNINLIPIMPNRIKNIKNFLKSKNSCSYSKFCLNYLNLAQIK
jgi:hypothetical protein